MYIYRVACLGATWKYVHAVRHEYEDHRTFLVMIVVEWCYIRYTRQALPTCLLYQPTVRKPRNKGI